MNAQDRLASANRELLSAIFAPPPAFTVSHWGNKFYVLPETSAEPGKFTTDRLPYLVRILDVLGDERVPEVTLAKSSQVAGSTVGEVWIGYLMDQQPGGILSVWPTEKKLRNWSRTRLEPMLSNVQRLTRFFTRTARREATDTIAYKEFPGGWLQLLTAKSTSDLRSASAPYLIAEEIDEWEGDIGGQGDSLELLKARKRTFAYGKLLKISSPTLEGFSRVWTELGQSTWEEYYVPCPFCNAMQTLRWRDGNEDVDAAGLYRLVWDRDADGEVIPFSTRYVCEKCNRSIDEGERPAMLRAGEWRARFPGRAFIHVGFHVNTLYSPLVPWHEIARAFQQSAHAPERRKVFVNTFLGLPYRDPGEAIDTHFLRERAEPLGENVEVPVGVGLVTADVDVQGDRLELFIEGWGAGEENWKLQWITLDGDPGQDPVWEALGRELVRARRHFSGAPVLISACAVDAGYQTERVHRFCDGRRARHVFATVGRAGAGKPLLKSPGAPVRRASRRERRPTHVIGTDTAKSLIYSRLRQTAVGPGYVHFADSLDPAYYDQLTAERLVTVTHRGVHRREWRRIESRANDALSGAIGNFAALTYLGPLTLRRLGALAKQYDDWKPTDTGAGAGTASGRRVISRGHN